MSQNRRDLLKLGGLSVLGAAGLAVPLGGGASTKSISTLAGTKFPKRYATAFQRPSVLTPYQADYTTPWKASTGGPAYYDVVAKKGSAQIIPGLTTPVYAYNGEVPGPVISVKKGTETFVRMRNHLPKAGPWGGAYNISTHLHGSESLPQFDGYAADTTAVGYYKDYHYPNTQAARTLWYHDHGQHWTAQNAYSGLAAQYHLHDDAERALLPQGEFDVPLTVTDAIFSASGSLQYQDNSHSGLWGDVILANGKPWPVMKVKRRTYRFRILDASIARSYRWKLSNGMPLQIVATDGGLMPKGVALTSFRQGGAERYEVVIDFSKVPASTKRIELLNGSNKNNVDYDYTGKVMAFDLVDGPVTTTRTRYDDPSRREPDPTWNRNYDGFPLVDSEIMSLPTSGNYKRRHFKLRRDDVTQQFQIDDTTWEDVVDSGYSEVMAEPEIGDTEIWEL